MADYGNSNQTTHRSDGVSLKGILVVLGALVFGLILLFLFTGGETTTSVDGAETAPAVESTGTSDTTETVPTDN